MNFEIKGKLIEKYDTQVISDKFQKREFVLETKETTANGFEYVETIKFQLTQDKVNVLDDVNIGEDITVHFNVKGRAWTNKQGEVVYFNSLDAWRIEKVKAEEGFTANDTPRNEQDEEDSGLPF